MIVKLKFLVIPLSYWRAKKIDSEKLKEIIDGRSTIYHITEEMNKNWSKLLKAANEQIITRGQNRIGEDLNDWIDRLVYEHYKIDEICVAGEVGTELKLQKCVDTHWSSLSPDLKADTRNLCQNY